MKKLFAGGYQQGPYRLERLWMDGQKGWELWNEEEDITIDVFPTKKDAINAIKDSIQ